jgi:glycyl-tRNA synthetase alpha subunit
MLYDNFKIGASPFIHDAYCKCGHVLVEVSNGFLSTAMFCEKCENVYQLKLVKTPASKISKEFIEQCKKRIKQK